jgi:hypothetical protein
MVRLASVLIVAAALAGCGLAETTVATGAGAAASAGQAQKAPKQLDKVHERLDAAQKAEADARAAAERAAE